MVIRSATVALVAACLAGAALADDANLADDLIADSKMLYVRVVMVACTLLLVPLVTLSWRGKCPVQMQRGRGYLYGNPGRVRQAVHACATSSGR
jgi:hypothetical protein|eukprot:COSAG01_NODE_1866_length_9033_cov_5.018359_12_plen_94_part_00